MFVCIRFKHHINMSKYITISIHSNSKPTYTCFITSFLISRILEHLQISFWNITKTMSKNDYMGDCNLDILEDNNIKIINKHLFKLLWTNSNSNYPKKKSKKSPNISWTISWQLCSQNFIIKINSANFF
jgi:hypothetical protein